VLSFIILLVLSYIIPPYTFFDITLEYPNKKQEEKAYLDAVKQLLPEIYKANENKIEKMIENTYSMLRTAKFIKGLEEDKDE